MSDAEEDETRTTADERIFFRLPEQELAARVPVVADMQERPLAKPRRRRHHGLRLPARRTVVRQIQAAFIREQGLGTAFLFVPVGLLAGILLYFSLPVEPAPWNVPAGILVLGALVALSLGTNLAIRTVFAAGLLVATGMALAQLHTSWKATQMLGSDVTTRLKGRIVAIEERANGRTRFTIDVLTTERPELRHAPGRVRVTAPGSAEGFELGGGVYGLVRLTSPSGPALPGGYDFAFHSYFNGIGANGFFLGRPDAIELEMAFGRYETVVVALQRLRRSISQQIQQAAPGRSGAVSAALVTGNKSGIPEDVTEALRVSGLAHILSISGLHMALVAATVMASLRLGFAFAPDWSARHPVRKYAAAGALAATGFYLFLAGAGVATQRSFVMLAIMLLALTFDRNAVTMRNLALAAVAVMIVASDEVAGPGFQMSFAATAALIAVYGGWQDWRHRRERQRIDRRQHSAAISFLVAMGRYALGIGITSLIAGLATGLFASYHFGRVAPYGLLANLAAMPVVTILVMPIAVAAMVAMPFGLHVYLFKAMAWAVELVIVIAERVAALSPAISTGQMPATALIAYTLGLILLCFPSTRFKLTTLPFLAMGTVFWLFEQSPVAIVSEDARQFAIIEKWGNAARLHVNRDRPNAFTVEQWQAAFVAPVIVKLRKSPLMRCDETVCRAETGKMLAGYVLTSLEDEDMPALKTLCDEFDLVIFAKAPSPQSCPNGTPVISAQMLARRGAAEIYENEGRPVIIHALPGPERPWLDHRRYSRAARNLPEWRRSQ
ncbi:MAG: competence protein ComEC [Ahrensia sp.]|nr:competence protein ComEC [Ahrensia sp.]|tara:strand:+ start:66914 stop:69259 length:2346 start_codon:yes stop_codon:yes gene_type:complete